MNILFIKFSLGFLIYAGINIGIAYWNNQTRLKRIKNKDLRQINHPVWAGIYAILCVPAYFIFHNIWFLIALVFLHISIFPVAYNLFSKLKPFNLSKTTSAITDRIMVALGLKNTALINVVGFLSAISLIIIAYLQNLKHSAFTDSK